MLKSKDAQILVKSWTGGRSEYATGYKLERVEALIDALEVEIDKYNENTKDGIIKRVSNDGYSEDYIVESEDEFIARLKRLAFMYLSGTGLMGAIHV